MPYGGVKFLALILLEQLIGLLEYSSVILEEISVLLEELKRILEDGGNGIELVQGLPKIEARISPAWILLEQMNNLLEQDGGILED